MWQGGELFESWKTVSAFNNLEQAWAEATIKIPKKLTLIDNRERMRVKQFTIFFVASCLFVKALRQ
jgi:hypothetical protein